MPAPLPQAPSLEALLALWKDKRWAELETGARTWLAADSANASVWMLLGSAQRQLGRPSEAVESHRRSLALQPDAATGLLNLGNALLDLDRVDDALVAFRRLVELLPNEPVGHFNLGLAFDRNGDWSSAIAAFREAIRLKPDYAEAWSDLGVALGGHNEIGASIAACVEALRRDPQIDQAYQNLGLQLFQQARHAESYRLRQTTLMRRPQDLAVNRAYLNHLNYLSEPKPAEIFAAHRQAHARLAPTFVAPGGVWSNDRDPERRLRIGYVSGDFRHHSCAWFLEPVLGAHDRRAVEILCYANVARPDDMTERLRGLADFWRDIHRLDDADAARLIRADAVDILVDCCGWTVDSRLPLFHAEPAPVQVTWLGYPNTTGFPGMRYRLTDAVADPPGAADALYVETLMRLPHGFLCYRPAEDAPRPAPPPLLRNGYVTFGSFNALPKLSDATVALWSSLLRAVPGSRLMLKTRALADGATAAHVAGRFAAQGIAADRLALRGWADKVTHHLAQYAEIDIALDPDPYNGTTTSCEALWMGVPVVTLCGDRHASRVGASLLRQVGQQALIAADRDAYVALAAALAADTARLTGLRARLRDDMARSPLCDAPGFARRLENAYRAMWRAWCAG